MARAHDVEQAGSDLGRQGHWQRTRSVDIL